MPYLLNGVITEEPFIIHSTNRSFRYGDGLFETIKFGQMHPLFYGSHYSRFILGLDALKIHIPDKLTMQYFFYSLKELIKQNEAQHGVIRLQGFRAGKGTYRSQTNDLEWIAELVHEDDQPFFTFEKTGVRLGVYQEMKKFFSSISAFKSSNSLPYVLAGVFAEKNDFDNVILLNDQNQVLEAISESVFIYSDGLLSTPKVEDGCVNGVMRGIIKKLAKWNKIDFEERTLTVEDLMNAQEIFLTNTVKGIIDVKEFEGNTYESTFTNGLKLKLNERIAQIMEKA